MSTFDYGVCLQCRATLTQCWGGSDGACCVRCFHPDLAADAAEGREINFRINKLTTFVKAARMMLGDEKVDAATPEQLVVLLAPYFE